MGRDSSGELTVNDSEVYEKWAQAVNSAYGLLEETLTEIEESQENNGLCMVLPFLVIPDETLWIVEYNNEGHQESAPKKVNNCQYYIGKIHGIKDIFKGFAYKISHLEIMTYSGLKAFLDDDKKWEKLFDWDSF